MINRHLRPRPNGSLTLPESIYRQVARSVYR
jgi:hypothetical protein